MSFDDGKMINFSKSVRLVSQSSAICMYFFLKVVCKRLTRHDKGRGCSEVRLRVICQLKQTVFPRWVTERDRLRRWGANLFSSFNAQRNRCDFLQDLHPDGISCFQRLVPERWLFYRKIRWIKLTVKPEKHVENVTKHLFWRRWIDQFWSLTKHVTYMTRYIIWRTKTVFKTVTRNSASSCRRMNSICTATSS